MTITITIYDEDGGETQHELPAVWEICDRCHGDGTHDPEAFDQGFTREDFDEDPDFAEDYRRGVYDVRCEVCDGTGKIKCVDADRLTDAQRAIYAVHVEREAEIAAGRRADAITERMERGIF